jgi:hypothetical protein
MPCYTEKTGGLLLLPDAGSKPSWDMFGRPNRWVPRVMWYSPSHPGINQHSPLGRLTPLQKKKKKKKNWTINNELKTSTQQKGQESESAPEKEGETRSWSPLIISKQKLERQKGQQQAGDKPLPEAGQVVDHKAHFLSQWATSKVKWLCKIEKQRNITACWQQGAGWQNTDPVPEKGCQAKKTSPQ